VHSWEPQQSIYRIYARETLASPAENVNLCEAVGWLKQAVAEAIVCFAASTA